MGTGRVVARPERLVLVVGTATEVGKTWVTARLAQALCRRGLIVAARKPVQSYGAGDTAPTDAEVLAGATGEPVGRVCPMHRWYPLPMAPPMAADALGRPAWKVADLVAEFDWHAPLGVGLVEAVGGVRSPLAADGDAVTLAEAVHPEHVVLVADAGLGTISGVRLAAGALERWPTTVILNRYDPVVDLHRRNRRWLAERDGFDVVTDPSDLVAPIVGWSR
jgi:dethiobiotin synthetase